MESSRCRSVLVEQFTKSTLRWLPFFSFGFAFSVFFNLIHDGQGNLKETKCMCPILGISLQPTNSFPLNSLSTRAFSAPNWTNSCAENLPKMATLASKCTPWPPRPVSSFWPPEPNPCSERRVVASESWPPLCKNVSTLPKTRLRYVCLHYRISALMCQLILFCCSTSNNLVLFFVVAFRPQDCRPWSVRNCPMRVSSLQADRWLGRPSCLLRCASIHHGIRCQGLWGCCQWKTAWSASQEHEIRRRLDDPLWST